MELLHVSCTSPPAGSVCCDPMWVRPGLVNVQTLNVLGVPDIAVLRCDHVRCFILHLPYIIQVYYILLVK